MSAIRKKLKSKSGISLAISLVFFLLCAMVGTVVLSAASVSAGNTARERQLYRQTLALTSAANLLSQDIQGMTFTGAYEQIEKVTTTIPPEGSGEKTKIETSVTYKKAERPKLEKSGLFQMESGKDDLNLETLYYHKQGKSWEGENTALPEASPLSEIALTFAPVEEEHIPQVTGTLSVKDDYSIHVVLSAGDNTLRMTFPPRTTEKTSHEGPTVNGSVKTTVTTYTTTLTWGQPLMQRGEEPQNE